MRLLNPGYESKSVNNSLYWNRGSGTCYNAKNNGTTSCNFSSTGLTEKSRNMIDDAKWYTATSASEMDITASESYTEERGSTVGRADEGITVIKTTSWTGKIGLIYPSDYGYASNGCRNGEKTLNYYNNESCASTNWLYNSAYQWLLTPRTTYNLGVRLVLHDARSGDFVGSDNAGLAYGIYPATYLSSSVKITGGDGTLQNAYELSL